MKYIILVLTSVILLSACTQKTSETSPVSSPETKIPENAKMQPGYAYPAVPLNEYQSGASK